MHMYNCAMYMYVLYSCTCAIILCIHRCLCLEFLPEIYQHDLDILPLLLPFPGGGGREGGREKGREGKEGGREGRGRKEMFC